MLLLDDCVTLRGCSAVKSLRIMVLRVIIRSVMGWCSACTLFISRETSARVGLLPAAVRHCCHCRKKKSRSVDEPTIDSCIHVLPNNCAGRQYLPPSGLQKKKSLFKTTMWLICRPRCNVLPTFVFPCVCAFSAPHQLPDVPAVRAQPIPCFNPKPAMCCSHWRTFFQLIAFAGGRHLLVPLARLLLQSAMDIFVSLHQLMPRTLPVQFHMLLCRLQFSAPRTPSKLINTLQEHPAQFETTSCCQVKGPLRFVAHNPLNAFFQAAKLNHTRKHQLRPCEVAKPCFKPPATATSRTLRRRCH